MLTKCLWEEFEFQLNNKWMGNYAYSSSEIAWLLLVVILITPIAAALDIIALPIEILHCISYKIVRKLRKKID